MNANRVQLEYQHPGTIEHWTYVNGGGRWIQVEGMYFFNFTNAAGLVYAANVTTDTVSGILGYAVAGSNPGSGVWWGTRPGAPHAALAAAAMPSTTF